MVQDRSDGQAYRSVSFRDLRCLTANQQLQLSCLPALRQRDADLLRRRRKKLPERAFHHHRIRQVHKMHRHRIPLPPHSDIQNARAGHDYWRRLVGGPVHCVAQQHPVIGREDFPESSINVPREVDYPPLAEFAHINFRNIRLGHARKYFLHGKVGIRRNQRERRIGVTADRTGMYARSAVDDPLGVVQPGKNRMALSRGRISFEPKIGVLHSRIDASGEGRPEKIGEPEIGAPYAPLVV